MTLITILAGLALEYFLGALDRFRNFNWFDAYCGWLERRCSQYRAWAGPGGVLLTLLLPVLLLWLVILLLGKVSVILVFLLSIAVFVYSLGPDLNSLLNRLIEAAESGDDAARGGIERRFMDEPQPGEIREVSLARAVFLRAHENIFGVVFWYIVLGMVGALLYSLVVKLNDKYRDIHGGYADAIRDLRGILMWPSARLLALGFALSGSLVHGLGAWRKSETFGTACGEEIIRNSGLGALHYHAGLAEGFEEGTDPYVSWIEEARALINRTLIIWLTVLGIMTLMEWI